MAAVCSAVISCASPLASDCRDKAEQDVVCDDDNRNNENGTDIVEDTVQINECNMTVNGKKTFSVRLYDTPAAQSLCESFPLSLLMSDMPHEKYCYLDVGLPTDAQRVSQIEAGDIMLWGNDCLVIFYESFTTSYSYTPLGKVTDAEALKEALAGENTRVELSLS